jgi:hypothetical protein
MKIPRIPVLPWWAEIGIQVAVLAGMAIAAEIIERKGLINASREKTDDDDKDTLEGEWWRS